MKWYYRLMIIAITPFAYAVLISIGVMSIVVDLSKLFWRKL